MRESSGNVRMNCFLNLFRAGEPVGNADHKHYLARHK